MEFPELEQQFRERYEPGDVQIYALTPFSIGDASDANIRRFIDDTGVSFPVMRDTTRTYSQYDAVGSTAPFPLDVVVGKDGRVVFVDTRFDPDALHTAIEAALAE